MGTGRVFHKAGPAMGKALDPVLIFIQGTKNLLEFVECRPMPEYFENFGQTSKYSRFVSCLSFKGSERYIACFKMNAKQIVGLWLPLQPGSSEYIVI